jgi:hypothetical protein
MAGFRLLGHYNQIVGALVADLVQMGIAFATTIYICPQLNQRLAELHQDWGQFKFRVRMAARFAVAKLLP